MTATICALLLGGAVVLGRPWPARGPLPLRAWWAWGIALLVATHLTGVLGWRWLAPAALVVLGAAGFGSVRGRQLRRREAATTGARVHEVCELLAAELAAGLTPAHCLEHAVEVWEPMAGVARAHTLGASVPDALREVARRPGAADVRLVAAAWEVSAGSGSGLTAALERVGGTLREREATRRLIRSELASARSTARLMAALPVLTLAMGSGVGGDPVRFLLTTPLGLSCLGLGLLLSIVGLRWIESISSGVEAAS